MYGELTVKLSQQLFFLKYQSLSQLERLMQVPITGLNLAVRHDPKDFNVPVGAEKLANHMECCHLKDHYNAVLS